MENQRPPRDTRGVFHFDHDELREFVIDRQCPKCTEKIEDPCLTFLATNGEEIRFGGECEECGEYFFADFQMSETGLYYSQEERKTDIEDVFAGSNKIYSEYDEGIITAEQAKDQTMNLCESFVEDNRIERREKKR
jgi:hypothetical protein